MPVVRSDLFVPTDEIPWLPLGDDFAAGGMEWKLVHTEPGDDRWTAMYRGPAGSYIRPHIHSGPAEGYILFGAVQVHAPYVSDGAGYLREAANANHPRTVMMADTAFILTMQGPLMWIRQDGSKVEQTPETAQALWDQQLAAHRAAN